MTIAELELLTTKVENARKALTQRSPLLEDFARLIAEHKKALAEIERLRKKAP